MRTSMPDITASLNTHLLFWAEDTQVLLTSAVLEFGTSFLWVQVALEKKKVIDSSSSSLAPQGLLLRVLNFQRVQTL